MVFWGKILRQNCILGKDLKIVHFGEKLRWKDVLIRFDSTSVKNLKTESRFRDRTVFLYKI